MFVYIKISTYVEFIQAMTDYPYPTKFLKPMPGWPVKVACQQLSNLQAFRTDRDLLVAIYKGISVYYNYTGKVKDCFNISDSSTGTALGDQQWDYQACSELVMPDCTDGKSDMFYDRPWNYTDYAKECRKNFAVTPDPEMALREYGGRNLAYHSNIIFSNGTKMQTNTKNLLLWLCFERFKLHVLYRVHLAYCDFG